MIYSQLEDIKDAMIKAKSPFVKVFQNSNRVAPSFTQEDKNMSAVDAFDRLENYIEGLRGNGDVEICIFEKNTADKAKGGNTQALAAFNLRIGELNGKKSNSGIIEGLSSNREKMYEDKILRLEEEVRSLSKKVFDYELNDKIRQKTDELEEKISGTDSNGMGFKEIMDAAKFFFPNGLQGGFQMPGATALAGTPASKKLPDDEVQISTEEIETSNEELRKYKLRDLIDDSTSDLEEIYGIEVVAGLFSKLAETAKKDKKTLENFFPMLNAL